MFVDASVIVAVLGREADHQEIEKRMAALDGPSYVSPLVKFEASAGLARMKSTSAKPTPALLRQAQAAVDAFVEGLGSREIEISPDIGSAALDAYGKAIGHTADLNFGDCFAYACAKSLGVGLLYKGNDFAQTDLA